MNAVRLAERLEADQLRAEMLALERLEEDLVVADRIDDDELLLLVVARVDADLLYAKQTAAARLEEDRRLALGRLEEDRRLIKRKHRRTDENKESIELTNEMKRVFTERFEEKQDGRVTVDELRDEFLKSTTIFNECYFKHHSRNLFLGQWTNARCSDKRCYVGVAVKSDE